MIALHNHPADVREAAKASCLAPAEREPLELREDGADEFGDRPAFELESAIGLRFADPPASEVRLQILEERPIFLVQRERERRADLDPPPKPGPKAQRDAEASLAFSQAGDEPRIQCCTYSIDAHSFDEGQRVAISPSNLARRPGRDASPFGSVVTGSLGLPSGLPAVQMDREGFPDMSWFSTTPRGVTGQVILTRQGISLP
jgi:hypothetical protein